MTALQFAHAWLRARVRGAGAVLRNAPDDGWLRAVGALSTAVPTSLLAAGAWIWMCLSLPWGAVVAANGLLIVAVFAAAPVAEAIAHFVAGRRP